jgi:hypothetical protein
MDSELFDVNGANAHNDARCMRTVLETDRRCLGHNAATVGRQGRHSGFEVLQPQLGECFSHNGLGVYGNTKAPIDCGSVGRRSPHFDIRNDTCWVSHQSFDFHSLVARPF